MIMRITWGKLYPNTWDEFERAYKETLDDLQAYEHSTAYQEMYAPRLRPFFSGEYTTYRCEVKYTQ